MRIPLYQIQILNKFFGIIFLFFVIQAEEEKHKDYVNIVFIGHVDAGKSTMSGQILKLTGMVDQRTLEKYERESREKNRESWALSWCIDTNDEERDKGKTVEYGKAFFETENKVRTPFLEEKLCTNFDPLNDFFKRRASYHFKGYKFRNLRAFEFF